MRRNIEKRRLQFYARVVRQNCKYECLLRTFGKLLWCCQGQLVKDLEEVDGLRVPWLMRLRGMREGG